MRLLLVAIFAGFACRVSSQDLETAYANSPREEVGLSAVLEIHELQAKGEIPRFSRRDKIDVSVPLGEISWPGGKRDFPKKIPPELKKDFAYPLTLSVEVKNLTTGTSAIVVIRRKRQNAPWQKISVTPKGASNSRVPHNS